MTVQATPAYAGEDRLRLIYEAALRPGAVVLDLGAHTGFHAAPLANLIAPDGVLYAIEPLPEARHELHAALSQTRLPATRWHIFDCAMGQFTGAAEFCKVVNNPGFSGLRERQYPDPVRLEKFNVAVRTIDDLFSEFPRIDYIKLDLEGGEYHALRGGVSVISRLRPLVSFEFGASAIREYDFCCEMMGEYWLSRNYLLFDVLGGQSTTPEAFAQSANAEHVWDYVAIPAENTLLRQRLAGILPNGFPTE